jgi:hypothetical protein
MDNLHNANAESLERVKKLTGTVLCVDDLS